MNPLKQICLKVAEAFKQVCLLPQTIMNAATLRRQRIIRDEHEMERLDRIRNPSKYLGR